MKVLIACEESQIVCKAFREKGHEAYSCDIQDCSGGHPEWHIKDDVLLVMDDDWDMMIAHPPCTYLSRAAGRVLYNKDRLPKTYKSFEFVLQLFNSNIKKIAIENPPGWLCTNWKKPDQKIHPYYFGDCEMKETCLWLKNLPLLYYYHEDNLFYNKTYTSKPIPLSSRIGSDGKIKNKYFVSRVSTAKLRSKTFHGIARAMADQWG
jgi:site-specific DNA-cytosine methylase